MGKSNTDAAVLNQLAPWVSSIHYCAYTQQWKATLLPQKIVIRSNFSEIVVELEQHVASEIIELVADVLGLQAAQAMKYTREQAVVDLRTVSAIVIETHFGVIRQTSLAPLLGWRTRASVACAKRLITENVIEQKLKRVYKTYPQLKTGNILIENNN